MNTIGWFEIYVQDMPRARAFYEHVFGRSLMNLAMEGIEIWAFDGHPEGGGAPGALVRMEGMSSGGNSVLVYFSSEDCAVEHARAVAAGQRSKPIPRAARAAPISAGSLLRSSTRPALVAAEIGRAHV